MSNPTNPFAGMDPSALMGQAQQTLQNPMAQAVPQGGGQIDPTQHPVIAALIKALSGGMQSYGWTAMQPQEREERQAMEQKKAETLAGLASTAAYREGELGYRNQMADVAGRRAGTAQQLADFKQQFAPQQLAEKTTHDQAMEALGQGRIDVASQRADAYVQSVKNRYDIAERTLGLGQGRLAVQEDLANIANYRAQLMATALNTTDATKRSEALTAVSKLESDHWIQDMLGMSGIQGAAGAAGAVPGAAPPVTGQPVAPQTAPANMPVPPPMIGGKAGAKAQQKGGSAPSNIPSNIPSNEIHYDFVPGKGLVPRAANAGQ